MQDMLQKIFQHRLFKQFAQMTFWRAFALAFGATASIWAARCLGPENLGISAMVFALVQQAALLIDLNLDPLLVREYKHRDSVKEQDDLVTTVFTYRFVMGVVFSLGILTILAFAGLSSKWWLAILVGVPYFIITSNDALWLLQAHENLPAQHRAMAIKSLIAAALFFAFFRSGIGPGWDVVVQTIAFGTAIFIAWKWAMQGRKIPLLNLQKFKAFLPLIKKGRWLLLTGLVMDVYTYFESPLLGWLHSVNELGKYRTALLATGALQSFLLLIPGLLYPRFIEWQKNGGDFLWQRQKILFSFGLLCLVPAAVLTFLIAPWFYKLYGSQFTDAVYPFAILLTAKYIATLSGIFTWGLWAQHRDKTMLAITGVAAVFSLCSNLLLIPHYGMWAAAGVSLTSELLILIGAFYWGKKSVTQSVSTK